MKYQSAIQLKKQLLGENIIAASAVARAHSLGMITNETRGPILSAGKAPMAIGVTGKNGKYKLAVRIQNHSAGMEVLLDDIRNRAKGETDVKIVGRVVKQQQPWHQKRNRPLRIGGSIGHLAITAGTLGCFVTKDGVNDLILSNNHVLANENSAAKGDAILQPGPVDMGENPANKIGELESFIRLKKSKNLVDCATASLTDGVEYYWNHLEKLGPIAGVRTDPLDEGEPVFKVGRTTGVTKGKVSAIEIDQLVVGFDLGDLSFDSQFEIEPDGPKPFSLGGDSGSLIVDSNQRAVGLLFAGNDIDATYANDITNVLKALKVDLVF